MHACAQAVGALAAALGLGLTTAHADAPHAWSMGFQVRQHGLQEAWAAQTARG